MATLALPMPATSAAPDHDAIPQHARVLVWSVIAAGAVALIARWPVAAPTPALAVFLLLASVVLSVMKLRLPLARSHATISMAYAIDFAALLLCGADVAMVIASIGVLVQCAFRVKVPQPAIRMVYSVATAVLSVQAAGLVWNTLRGDLDALQFATTIAPMLVTAVVYFIVNTGLIALAIGLTTAMAPVRLWHDEFLWSARPARWSPSWCRTGPMRCWRSSWCPSTFLSAPTRLRSTASTPNAAMPIHCRPWS